MGHHHDILRSDHKDLQTLEKRIDRRQFLTKTSLGLGALALGSLLNSRQLLGNPLTNTKVMSGLGNGLPGLPHFSPKAKRIVYLFQSGWPLSI